MLILPAPTLLDAYVSGVLADVLAEWAARSAR